MSSDSSRENVMSRPVSISVGEISKAARASVEKALGGHKAAFPVIPDHRIGFVPPYWWYGFVIYDAQLDKLGLGEAQKSLRPRSTTTSPARLLPSKVRSEERRVGKECR